MVLASASHSTTHLLVLRIDHNLCSGCWLDLFFFRLLDAFQFDKFKIEAGCKPELVISRQDISHIVGIVTESLVRILADFKVEKLIELKVEK